MEGLLREFIGRSNCNEVASNKTKIKMEEGREIYEPMLEEVNTIITRFSLRD